MENLLASYQQRLINCGEVIIDLKVISGAKKLGIAETFQQNEKTLLKIKTVAHRVEGKANQELIGILSECFGVRKNDVSIIQGEKSSYKTVLIRKAS
ncbi:MAG: DUF167 domain-containing protein [Patescibacteria group bacterium]|nr:DUF167 domain-containing protein [Patescibacteria group bacterium]